VKRLLPALPLCVLLALALGEVAAHVHARSVVPALGEWRDAARFVRSGLAPRDLLVAAPHYADPLLRQVLGDAIDLPMAGRSDDAAYERVWVIAVGDAQAREARGVRSELRRSFGRLTVSRYALGPSPVLADLTARVRDAAVRSGERECSWRSHRLPRGGGLGLGVLPPVERFGCAGGGWVAPVVQEDLSLQPRYCVRQGVVRGRTLRVELPTLPLGKRLVFYGGLYYEDERMRRGAPVDVRVLIDGRELGRLRHRDGDGWRRTAWRTPGGSGAVAVEVRSDSERERSYCWAATTRSTDQDRAP
jgi:hypothetical protein